MRIGLDLSLTTPRGRAAWVPTTLGAKLRYWYEFGPTLNCSADNAGTSPGVVGGFVNRLADLSGNGRHLVPPLANKLTLRSTAWGYAVETGANNALYLATNPYTGAAAGEIAFRRRNDATGDRRGAYIGSSGNDNWNPFGGQLYSDFGSTSRKDAIDYTGDLTAEPRVVQFRSAAGDWRAWFDGVLLHTDAANVVGWRADAYFSFDSNPIQFTKAIIGTDSLTDAERAAVLAYLQT